VAAQVAINRLAESVIGKRPNSIRTLGISFDQTLAKFGSPAPKVPIIYADAKGFDAAGFGDAGFVTDAEEVISVTDRGLLGWDIEYKDGTDEIPKDPNVIDSMAAAEPDPNIAARLRMYANNIRDTGRPVPEPPHGFAFYFIVGIGIAGIFLLRGFR
jgi:hypothetical protein